MLKKSALIYIILLLSKPCYGAIQNGMDADIVIGQPNFTSSTAGTTAYIMNEPLDISVNGDKIVTVEGNNSRLLIFDRSTLSNFPEASVVLGQPNFTSSSAATTRTGMRRPNGVFFDGRRLFVADSDNHRVLIWNTLPTQNTTPPDVVLGQSSFITANADDPPTASSLNSPFGIFSDGKRLFLADLLNSRVLIWKNIPTVNNAPADIVLGQPNFVSNTANNGGRSARTLNFPASVRFDGQKLYVADFFNARILIWNSLPNENFTPADVVVGQKDFTTSVTATSQSGIAGISYITTDGKYLFGTDTGNSRILVWDHIPTKNGELASYVLGQNDFTSAVIGVSASKFGDLTGIDFDGKRLFVTTGATNRVLIYNIGNTKPELSPQFTQGKAVLGKVFHDLNENGTQDQDEKGLEGIKIASDTGIYAITDEDGKYHYPFIETGQHVLKIDESSLPRGSKITSENPRHITVTEGVLTKVSFGVQLLGEDKPIKTTEPLLKVSISEDPTRLKPILQVQATQKDSKLLFNITCNYYLFIQKAELILYTKDLEVLKTISLPNPLPLYYEIPLEDLPQDQNILYQLKVYDQEGHEDRTGVGEIYL